MLEKTGIPNFDDIFSKFPKIERINKSGVAFAQCFQEIPCNPCSTSCPKGAITIGDNINNIPEFDFEKCIGCGLCVVKCPGLAINVVDGSTDKDKIIFKIPYEMLPLPVEGQEVIAVDREGNYLSKAQVVGVKQFKEAEKTYLVSVEIERDYMYEFATIKVEEQNSDCCKTIICRCSDVDKEQIRQLLQDGYTTFEEIKRILRVGMGPCQGRTCGQLVAKEIASFTKESISDISLQTTRPTVTGVKLSAIANGSDDLEE